MQETWVWLLGREDSPGDGICYSLQYSWASLVAQLVKNLPAKKKGNLGLIHGTWVQSLGWKILWRRERLPTPVSIIRYLKGWFPRTWYFLSDLCPSNGRNITFYCFKLAFCWFLQLKYHLMCLRTIWISSSVKLLFESFT